jgi:chorismate-pyruvate lyase
LAFLAQLGNFDAGSLDMLQRILLISDGTLTDTLEAAFLEPIALQKVALDIGPAPRPVVELDLAAGENVMERKIFLRGESSGRAYVYAESVLVLDRLPPRFREELVESDMPMGRLWSEHKLETWKELLDIGRHPMGPMAACFGVQGTDCLVRRYRVISGGRPLMSIAEHFPATYRKPGE